MLTRAPPSFHVSAGDLLLGLDGVHVEHADRRDGLLIVTVSIPTAPAWCPSCGVVAPGRRRGRRVLKDVPGTTWVRIVWWHRVWRCGDDGCTKKTFVGQLPSRIARRGSITARTVDWAFEQLCREHATVHDLACHFGTSRKTLWRAIKPELVRLADDESRFDGFTTLGGDERIWHRIDPRQRGPKEPSGMGDLTRDQHGKTRTRLLLARTHGYSRLSGAATLPAATHAHPLRRDLRIGEHRAVHGDRPHRELLQPVHVERERTWAAVGVLDRDPAQRSR